VRQSRPGTGWQRGHITLSSRRVAGQPLIAVARRHTRLAIVFRPLGDTVGKNTDSVERAAQPLGAVRVTSAPDPSGVHARWVARAIGPAVARGAFRPNLATGPGFVAPHRRLAHAVGAQNADAARRAHGARIANTTADDGGTGRRCRPAPVVAAVGTYARDQVSTRKRTSEYE
jgi:hypothetical protein